METSLQLAQIIGPFFIIVWLSMLFNWKNLSKIFLELLESKAMSWTLSFFMIILWLIMITIHNIWIKDWTVIITILWWIILVKWSFIMLFPNFMLNLSKFFLEKCKNIFYVAWILRILIWVYLINIAYFS